MFTTFIVQPIFNLLVLIYAVLPGHNFGLAIIIFTIIIRLLLWPLVKKQLHQAKLMRKIQPELKKIAKQTKGDKVKQGQMQMELYKERGINPFSSIGVALLQLPVLIGLYIGLQRVIKDPNQMVDFAYPALQNLGWMQQLSDNIKLFDSSLFGIVDLGRAAIGPQGLYVPALIIVLASAVTQYFQAKQLMPNDKDARSLRAIMKDAGAGKQADQSEVSAAIGRSTRYILPVMIFVFTVNIASALGLYWFIGGLVAFIQQSIVLGGDSKEMEELSESGTSSSSKKSGKNTKDTMAIPEAEIIDSKSSKLADKTDMLAAKSSKKTKSFQPKSGSTVTSVTYGKKQRRR
ncbi:MAG TPA: YidC/Oxa1 family membrane protein insertase [Candidatus Saccharimonadales bacterium]|jgi:YidC/Oxa1 family membrane protein insertase